MKPRIAVTLLCAAMTLTLYVCGSTAAQAASEFGVAKFALAAVDEKGEQYTQAGGHPYAITSVIEFNTRQDSVSGQSVPVEEAKDVIVDVPAGLVGNPQATFRCSRNAFLQARCPGSTQVGTFVLNINGTAEEGGLYNLTVEAGHPAQIGLITPHGLVFVLTIGVRTGNGYGIRVEDIGIPEAVLYSASLTLWGVPADPSHNAQRGRSCFAFGGERFCQSEGNESDTDPLVPFLTLPTDCAAGPTTATVTTDSWEKPGVFVTATASPSLPAVTGCNLLSFAPAITARLDTSRVDAPTDLEFGLEVPQTESPTVLSTPELRDVAVKLPLGLSLSPAGADGLQACSDKAFAVSSGEPAECPRASQVGTAVVKTPLLPRALEGAVFIGEPLCGNAAHAVPCQASDARDGRLYRLFMEIQGSGVMVKLPGIASVDPDTGQITTNFTENPELPFGELLLQLKGGARAPVVTPQTCGSVVAAADLRPWSAPGTTPEGVEVVGTPDANVVSPPFEINGCQSAPLLRPGFSAGTVQVQGGEFSTFTMNLARNDGEQNLAGASIVMPPGVTAMLSKVQLCHDAEANAGTCSEASRIGSANVAAGAGSEPLWLSGRVYLTGPYKGAPFGLSIVVPAKAGPFNLGDEVVRAAISVDPNTAQVTVTSDPLRQIRDGVPFRLKVINVTIDRPEFVFNPTNCEQLHVTGAVAGLMPNGSPGSTVAVSNPFAAAGCKNLPFKPSFSASTTSNGSRSKGASLHVVVKSTFGQANIRRVHVTLPKALPSRLSTLKQACSQAQFSANPSGCPAGSLVGTATAHTPVLPVALTGPAYFVSHGGAGFPDLVVVLQGDGVTVDLTGGTNVSKGITSSTFASVPDVPITRFDLVLPQGPHSALAAIGNLCKGKLAMPTTITGQNGAQIKRNTVIAVAGCRRRPAHSPHHHQKKRHGTHAPGHKR